MSLLALPFRGTMLFDQRHIPADELQVRASVYRPPFLSTFKVETRLVEVGVVVRDSRGEDIARLPSMSSEGVHTLQLAIVAELFDQHNAPAAGREAHVSIALKSDTYQQLVNDGLNLELALPAPPGVYQLRCVIQQEPEGKFTASAQPIEIRQT